MEVIMLNKVLLPAAIVAVSQLGMGHHVSAMEKPDKTPESKIDQPEDKSGLTEEEKKRLTFNRMVITKAIEQTHGEDIAKHGSKDVREVISGKEYALAKGMKFTCPTPQQLHNSMKDNSWEHISDEPNLSKLTFSSHDQHLFGSVHSLRDAIIGDENTRQDGKQYRVIYCTYNYVNQYATDPEVNLREDDFVDVHMSIPLDQYSIEFNEQNKEFTLTKK